MTLPELASAALMLAGAGFFTAGTFGLLRFPDVYTRLHALAKVDNLGLGLIACGLMLRADGPAQAAKIALVWLLALAASASVSYLIAHRAISRGIAPWRAQEDRSP